jgi:hypothetical protein
VVDRRVKHCDGPYRSSRKRKHGTRFISLITFYRRRNKLFSLWRSNQVLLFRQTAALCAVDHTNHVCTLCGRSAEYNIVIYHSLSQLFLLFMFTTYIKLHVSAPLMSNFKACARSWYIQFYANTMRSRSNEPSSGLD